MKDRRPFEESASLSTASKFSVTGSAEVAGRRPFMELDQMNKFPAKVATYRERAMGNAGVERVAFLPNNYRTWRYKKTTGFRRLVGSRSPGSS